MINILRTLVYRDVRAALHQKTQILSSLVRPLLWFGVIGSGIKSITENVGSLPYDVYIVPGLLGMTLLFGSMVTSLGFCREKENSVMRMLLTAPSSRKVILLSRLCSTSVIAIIHLALLLFCFHAMNVVPEIHSGAIVVLGVILTALMWSGIGLLIGVMSDDLENFAAIMNFVIFPVFFLSGALYPLKNLPSELLFVTGLNPFAFCIDLIQHGFGFGFETVTRFSAVTDIAVICIVTVVACGIASFKFSKKSFDRL